MARLVALANSAVFMWSRPPAIFESAAGNSAWFCVAICPPVKVCAAARIRSETHGEAIKFDALSSPASVPLSPNLGEEGYFFA